MDNTKRTAKTMGQALDEAVAQHKERYPGSEPYGADVTYSLEMAGFWRVELKVAHFSQDLVYHIERG
jgi:hypothetical protein